MRNLKLFILIIAIHVVVIVFITSMTSAESSGKTDINIEVTPNDSLFTIEDMKPGDWAPRSVVVKNKGEKEVEYQMSLQNNGTEKLFNELMLEIRDKHVEIFNGKLADFSSLNLRNLAADDEEELQITVRFPEHLGNEFQGLKADITLLFTAKRDKESIEALRVDGTTGSGDEFQIGGSTLPNTATHLFQLLLIGGALLIIGSLLITYNNRKQFTDIK